MPLNPRPPPSTGSEFSKVALQVLQALQQLLLTHGHSLRGRALSDVARAVQPYLRRAWREARLARFKVCAREGPGHGGPAVPAPQPPSPVL
jgi:hypothetical protein